MGQAQIQPQLQSLYGAPLGHAGTPTGTSRRQLLGAVYLDSKRTATFSVLDRQIAVGGQVLRNGNAHVRVARGSSYADGQGRLSRDGGGSGVWQGASSGTCSGTWTAERR